MLLLVRRTAFCVLSLPFLAPPLWGQSGEPLITDRPDFTESTVAVSPGSLQLEAGYTLTRAAEVESHALGEVLLRLGAVPGLELRLGLSSYVIEDRGADSERGFADLFVGTKLELLEGSESVASWRPSVAVLAGTTLPTGDDALGSDEVNPGATLALGWEVSSRVAIGSNLSVASLHSDGDRFEQVSGSVSLAAALTDRVGAYVEFFGFSPQEAQGPDASFLNGGVTLLVGYDLQFDARAGVGLNDVDPDYFLGVGAAWRLRL